MGDCDDIHRHVRDICECTREGLTLEKCNKRRALWGRAPLDALPEKEAPPVLVRSLTTGEKITSFLGVSAQTVWRYVTLRPGLLTNEEMQPRLDICNACPKLVDAHCTLCGCKCIAENTTRWMAKVAHPTAKCPIGKW